MIQIFSFLEKKRTQIKKKKKLNDYKMRAKLLFLLSRKKIDSIWNKFKQVIVLFPCSSLLVRNITF